MIPDTESPPLEQRLFTCAESVWQTVPVLKPGTAATGALAFGAQIGTARLKAGNHVTVLAHLSPEAFVGHLPGDTRELLILTKLTQPHHD